MKTNPFYILSIFFFFTFQCIFISVNAQQNIERDTTKLVDFDILSTRIEKNNRINLFYKSEWFANKRFREAIADLPLEDCLTIVKRLTELNCYEINSTTYIFVPVEIRNYSNKVNRNGVLIIGDTNDPESKIGRASCRERV